MFLFECLAVFVFLFWSLAVFMITALYVCVCDFGLISRDTLYRSITDAPCRLQLLSSVYAICYVSVLLPCQASSRSAAVSPCQPPPSSADISPGSPQPTTSTPPVMLLRKIPFRFLADLTRTLSARQNLNPPNPLLLLHFLIVKFSIQKK